MNIIINHTSMQPIYEQINAQIKALVIAGDLKTQEMLPSVRTLAKELKISALTVKKAYDSLEEEGFVVTVHGKGSFIAGASQELLQEERRRVWSRLWRRLWKRAGQAVFRTRRSGRFLT